MGAEHQWYIKIRGQKEGPYSLSDLEDDPRFGPHTPVWKKGFKEWRPACEVAEMRQVFVQRRRKRKKKPPEPEYPARFTPDGLVLDARGPPPNLLMWLLIIVFVIVYVLYKLNSAF